MSSPSPLLPKLEWCRHSSTSRLIREYFTAGRKYVTAARVVSTTGPPFFPNIRPARRNIFTFPPNRLIIGFYFGGIIPSGEGTRRRDCRDREIYRLVCCFTLLTVLQTALHWAAKHGDENIVKLIAGTYKDYIKSVNETSVSERKYSSYFPTLFLQIKLNIFFHRLPCPVRANLPSSERGKYNLIKI